MRITPKRLVLIIAIVSFLALITAWHQIQIIRWEYRISEQTELKRLLLEEQKRLESHLTYLESPEQLLALARLLEVELDYPEKFDVINHHQLTSMNRPSHQAKVAIKR